MDEFAFLKFQAPIHLVFNSKKNPSSEILGDKS